MSLAEFVAKQLRQPSGWFGSLILSRMMNSGNRRIVGSTINLLEIEPQHQVLEIGFGGGAALALLVHRIEGGAIWGLDLSPEMVSGANRRFGQEIAAGRLRLQVGDVTNLPYVDTQFDRVLTINNIYFWSDIPRGLGEISRVLKPEGRVAVSIRSKRVMSRARFTRHGFRLFSPEELADVVRAAGFHNPIVYHSDQEKLYDQVIVVAVR